VSDHPAKIKGPLWYGTECEGQHSGKHTAFVAHHSVLDQGAYLFRDVDHVFLTEDFAKEDPDEAWRRIDLLHSQFPRVSIVVAREPEQVADFAQRPQRAYVGLMLRLFLPSLSWLAHLTPEDEIALGVPYHQIVAKREGFREARPADYSADYEVVLRSR
jgi:hypothetical protein